jgi:hypothetical protein
VRKIAFRQTQGGIPRGKYRLIFSWLSGIARGDVFEASGGRKKGARVIAIGGSEREEQASGVPSVCVRYNSKKFLALT